MKGYVLTDNEGMIEDGITEMVVVSGINLKNTGVTNLLEVPTGKTAVIVEIILRITDASSVTVGATLSVGKSNLYTDWLVATSLGNLSSSGQFRKLSQSSSGAVFKTFSSGETVAINVTVGATATTLTASADVFGYLY